MSAAPRRVEGRFYADYLCPWCYVAAARLHRLRAHFGSQLRLLPRSYPLFPGERTTRRLSPHGIISRLRAGLEAERDGLRFRAWPEDSPTPRSSLEALAASKCAGQQGEQAFERFDLALYRAYFEQCRDISQREIIVALADEVGLERKPFLAALERGTAQAAVLADYQEYRQRFGRVQPGIPLLELDDGRQIAGAVPLDTYYTAIAPRLGA